MNKHYIFNEKFNVWVFRLFRAAFEAVKSFVNEILLSARKCKVDEGLDVPRGTANRVCRKKLKIALFRGFCVSVC
jgi:hypothetical protein